MFRRTTLALAAFAVFTFAVGVAPAFAQTVDEILAKHYTTKGGLEKWKSIQTQKMTGVASAQGFELAMVIYGKRPNMGRQDMTITIPGQPPVTMINVFDGAKAWMVNPMSGSDAPVEMSGAEADTVKEQSDFDGSLVDYQAKGHTIELVGTETLGTKKVHHLKVTRKGLPTQHYFLDAELGTEVKITTEAGAGPAVETEMSEYRTVEGVQVAHLIRVLQGGQVQAELRITKAEFNVPIEDSLFKIK